MADDELMRHYSDALDEVWQLRTALAYEAHIINKRLAQRPAPKSGKSPASEQVDRMRAAAGGDLDGYKGMPARERSTAQYLANMRGLTRQMWENR